MFRNKIAFGGVPHTVAFNVQDESGERYQRLVPSNKTPGLNNTAVKSLVPTDQVSYEDNIAPLREDVKDQAPDNNISTARNNNPDVESVPFRINDTLIPASFATLDRNK